MSKNGTEPLNFSPSPSRIIPVIFVAYHNRAVAYSKKGEYDKSIQDLKKATQLNPDYPDAYGLLGLVYEIKKDNAAALEAYREALSREKRPAVRKIIEKNIQDIRSKIEEKVTCGNTVRLCGGLLIDEC